MGSRNHRHALRRPGRRRGLPQVAMVAVLVAGSTSALGAPASAATTTAGFDGVLTSRASTISYEVALTEGSLGGTLAFSSRPAGGPRPTAKVSLLSADGRRLVTRHGAGPLVFDRELAAGSYTLEVSAALPRRGVSLAFYLEVTHVTTDPAPTLGQAEQACAT